ncbi:MAG TPA: two-component regulator propeller domain-containing protein [Cytophagaceae bacterium]|nr:two-component regulator propeller domain-containing protein [Cytophagaceae bacterium]
MLKSRTWLSLFFIIIGIKAYGQIYNFHNYNTEDGVSQSYIYHILQSEDGCLWIGTGEGLTRFNGKDFDTYTTKDGLAGNFITKGFKDSRNHLWFGHYNGRISYYNGTGFSIINAKETGSPVSAILEDKYRNIWVSTQHDGLVRISASGEVSSYKNVFADYTIHCLALNNDGSLLAGTNDGILSVKIRDRKIEIGKMPLENLGEVLSIVPMRDGNGFWIGTKENGLIQYRNDSGNSKFKYLLSELKDINLIYGDSLNNLYVGSYGYGIVKYNLKNNIIQQVAVYHKSTGLSNDHVRAMLIDKENNLWLGTYGNGLDLLVDPLFTLYSSSQGISGQSIFSLLYDFDENIWAGSSKRLTKISLNNFGLQTGSGQVLQGLPEGEIKALFQLPDKDILIATGSFGVYRYEYHTGKISKWFYNEEDPLSNRVNTISADKQGNIWLATYSGVYRFEKDSNIFEHFTIADGLSHNLVYSIFPDSKGTIWFATHESGISRYLQGKFESVNLGGVEAVNINCFTEDAQGTLWIGTYGDGIYAYDGRKFIKHLTKADGLGSDYCYLLTIDRNNNLWVGHKEGVSKYNPTEHKFNFYKKQDGFLGGSVNLNSVVKDATGCVWFGTKKGLVRYNPDADRPKIVSPMTQITAVDLFYKKVEWRNMADSLFGTYRLPYEPELKHNSNHLTFNYVGISLRPGEKLKYQYMLDGFDDKWSLLSSETFATYSNLPDGSYIFKVRAQNIDGLWGAPASFSFHLLKPYWKSWWFLILSCIVLICTIVFIIRLRTMHLQKRQIVLKKQRDRLLAEIKERKIAEMKRKESEKKLKQSNEELNTFIYRSSHDLKGPLASVMGLTYLAQKEISESNALNYFSMISDCTRKLDNILEGLLEATMIKDWKVESTPINFHEIVNKILLSYETLRDQIKFNINIAVYKEFCSDVRLVGSLIQYIVNNSVQYRKTGEESEINIHISDHKKGVLIWISDNGIGISKRSVEKVFDMFYKASLISKGPGLGLYLAKNSIEKLEGKVSLTSEEDKGTRVEVFLPALMIQKHIQPALKKRSFTFTKMD